MEQLSYVSKVGMTDTDNQDRQWGLAALADGLDSLIPINEASGQMLAETSMNEIHDIIWRCLHISNGSVSENQEDRVSVAKLGCLLGNAGSLLDHRCKVGRTIQLSKGKCVPVGSQNAINPIDLRLFVQRI